MINKMKELKSALQKKDLNLAFNLAIKIKQKALATRTCANCCKPTDHQKFIDSISYEESFISGLCMPCQEIFFRKEDDEIFEFELPFKEKN